MKLLFVLLFFAGSLNIASSRAIDLQGIQSSIDMAFQQSFVAKNTTKLSDIAGQLKQDGSSLATYWYAYAMYMESLFYLQSGDQAQSEKSVSEGVKALAQLPEKNSEDYALLALMQTFSMQFMQEDYMKVLAAFEEVHANIQKSMNADANNLRAYLVDATINFYTPEPYGDAQKAEEDLLKCIALNAQQVEDVTLPSWGKARAYSMLVSLYTQQGKQEMAKRYLDEALKSYPDNDELTALATQIH
ncbi:MAG: hypothetical protein LBE56_08315 [Tannerella sp.]|jgi:tetratricopeptide (TPR) repeat protein|nr:hypothetical protein [Tannerella sp.]